MGKQEKTKTLLVTIIATVVSLLMFCVAFLPEFGKNLTKGNNYHVGMLMGVFLCILWGCVLWIVFVEDNP